MGAKSGVYYNPASTETEATAVLQLRGRQSQIRKTKEEKEDYSTADPTNTRVVAGQRPELRKKGKEKYSKSDYY